jgi:hypothetical protein
MVPADLPAMASLLGDADVMWFYPAPRTHEQASSWIDRGNNGTLPGSEHALGRSKTIVAWMRSPPPNPPLPDEAVLIVCSR